MAALASQCTATQVCVPTPHPKNSRGTGHRGGNHDHNRCADSVLPNDFWCPENGEMAGCGSDACILSPTGKKKALDAFRFVPPAQGVPSILAEIKYQPGLITAAPFIQDMELSAEINQDMIPDLEILDECAKAGFEYRYFFLVYQRAHFDLLMMRQDLPNNPRMTIDYYQSCPDTRTNPSAWCSGPGAGDASTSCAPDAGT